jgi:hypothetical protein
MDHMAENEQASLGANASQGDSLPTSLASMSGNKSGCDSPTGSESKLYPVKLIFYELSAEGKVDVTIYPFCSASWSSGSRGLGVAQISVEVPQGAVMPIKRFAINRNRFSFRMTNSCDELRLSLYLSSNEKMIQGRVDLSTGGWVRLKSEFDETNVTQRGSFALMVEGVS